jgi:hypothetical protein
MDNVCQSIRERIPELLAGTLSAEKADELRCHIGQCLACGEYLQALQADDQLLSDFAETMQPTVSRLESNVVNALNYAPSEKPVGSISIWRTIMKSRIAKVAAAAAIVIAVLVGILQFDGTTPAYAITDVLGSLRDAKTVHIKGRNFSPPVAQPNQEQKIAPFECWLDLENERARIKHCGSSVMNGQVTIYFFEEVIDRRYRMHINHSQKCVTYYSLNTHERQEVINKSLDFQLKQIFGDPDRVEAFELTGVEQIGNSTFDIWQAEVSVEQVDGRPRLDIRQVQVSYDPGSEAMLRIKMWLSSETGQIGRVRMWIKEGQTDWGLAGEIDKIERNVLLPTGIFEADPPQGYVVKNSEDEPQRPELPKSAWYQNKVALAVYGGFMLDDGSVIAVWSSSKRESGGPWSSGKELADVSQIELFRGLQPGDAFPKLPVVVSSLRRKSLWGTRNSYTGRHLAHTIKDQKIYEWGIYVPEKKTGGSPLGYDAVLEFNPEEQGSSWNYKVCVGANLLVNEKNFESVLLGYMADFSDDFVPPDCMTYENLLVLAQKIRTSLGQ